MDNLKGLRGVSVKGPAITCADCGHVWHRHDSFGWCADCHHRCADSNMYQMPGRLPLYLN